MARILYPIVQQPILTEAQRPEAVTADRVHQDWSLPVGRLNARRAVGFAVALLAAGQFMSPNDLPNTGQTVDMYNFGWSEPVRVAPRLATASQAPHGFTPAAPFEEAFDLAAKWFHPLSEPVRVPQRLTTGAQQAFAISAQALTEAETVFIDKYLYPLAEPVRIPPALKAALQPTTVISPVALTEPEQVSESRWHQPWSEPQRDAQAQRNHLVLRTAAQHVTPPNPFGMAFEDTVRWYQPLSEPQRDLAGQRNHRVLRTASQQTEPLNPFGMTQPETVHVNKFLIALSEPVRIKRGLYAPYQRDFTISTSSFIVPEDVKLDKYLYPLSEPVRLKPGLRKDLQVYATIDPFALTLRRASARCYLIV